MTTKVKRLVVVTDSHCPAHSVETFDLLLQRLKTLRVDWLVHAGDLVDLAAISRYMKDNRRDLAGLDVLEEFETASRYLRALADASRATNKDCKFYFLGGNHDEGRVNKFCAIHPELTQLLSLRRNLPFEDCDIRYVPMEIDENSTANNRAQVLRWEWTKNDVRPVLRKRNEPRAQPLPRGVALQHGRLHNMNAERDTLRDWGIGDIYGGHLHRATFMTGKHFTSMKARGGTIPCAADLRHTSLNYPSGVTNWVNGWGEFIFDPSEPGNYLYIPMIVERHCITTPEGKVLHARNK